MPPLDVAYLLLQEAHEPPFYIQNILPVEGSMLLFGNAKFGKSWMAEQIAYCLATGTSFLNFPVRPARVLIIQFEISHNAYHKRLKDMAMRAPFSLREGCMFCSSPGMKFINDEADFSWFCGMVDACQPEVLILDPMQACYNGDENDSGQVQKFISKVESLKARHHSSLILVHHTRKAPAVMSTSELARGTSRLVGWVDTLAALVWQGRNRQIQFMCRQAETELPDMNIKWDRDRRVFEPL